MKTISIRQQKEACFDSILHERTSAPIWLPSEQIFEFEKGLKKHRDQLTNIPLFKYRYKMDPKVIMPLSYSIMLFGDSGFID